jgi:AGCS family alanine or glycine:cation symporter
MYYIKKGLGPSWHWLATIFAFFGMVAAFGIGNTVQSNSVADVMSSNFAVEKWLTGLSIAALTAAVIIGGIKRIAAFAGTIVPLMALIFVSFSLFVIVKNISLLPATMALIISSAFETESGVGVSIWLAMRWGFARGIFSNEAGLGSAAIAHAAARTDNPMQQGKIAMLGTFIDTICICSLTAFVIIMTGMWNSTEQGASLSALAFTAGVGAIGGPLIALCLAVFAFTTIIGWSYYGERCAEYLFGARVIFAYRVVWVLTIIIGAIVKLEIIWALADIFNGLMALPNLIALLLLSPVVFRLSKKPQNS